MNIYSVITSPFMTIDDGRLLFASNNFLFIVLYREDSDDDDIEKGDSKIPR